MDVEINRRMLYANGLVPRLAAYRTFCPNISFMSISDVFRRDGERSARGGTIWGCKKARGENKMGREERKKKKKKIKRKIEIE